MAPHTVPSATLARRPLIPLRSPLSTLMVAAAVAGLVGCSSTGQLGNLAEIKQIAASCPLGHEIAGFAAIDVSGARLAVAGDAGRLAPVHQLAERVTACGGHLRVDVFSGGEGAVGSVYDADLHAPGATENARLRRIPSMVDDVMTTITKNLPTVAATLPRTGKDIDALFGLSGEYVHQLDPDGTRYVLNLVITTDGVQTEPPSLTDPALTADKAVQLASLVQAPNLSGADVSLTDIGKPPDRSLSSGYVDALKAFYRTVCAATKAAHCTIVTDAAGQ